jgi:hypothetical protein
MKYLRALSVLLRIAGIITFLFCLAKAGADSLAYLKDHVKLTLDMACWDTTLAMVSILLCLASVGVQQSTRR